jgi:hypothetical protein
MVSPWTNADSHGLTNSPLAVYLDRTVAIELPTKANHGKWIVNEQL